MNCSCGLAGKMEIEGGVYCGACAVQYIDSIDWHSDVPQDSQRVRGYCIYPSGIVIQPIYWIEEQWWIDPQGTVLVMGEVTHWAEDKHER